MLGYGRDESAPTPGGMFRNPFRGCTWVYCGVFYGVSWVYVGILQFVRSVVADRQQHYRNPFAAVGVRFIAPVYT